MPPRRFFTKSGSRFFQELQKRVTDLQPVEESNTDRIFSATEMFLGSPMLEFQCSLSGSPFLTLLLGNSSSNNHQQQSRSKCNIN